VAASVLSLLRGDAGQRALAAWALGWDDALEISGNDWEALFLGVLLGDPYDAVRHVAFRSLRNLPGFEGYEYDFLSSEGQRFSSGNEVINGWLAVRDPGARSAPELLLDPNGRPRMSRLMELLSERDDRPVLYAE
jgi:hypothetical protein